MKLSQIRVLILSFLVGLIMFAGGVFAVYGIKGMIEVIEENRMIIDSEELSSIEKEEVVVDLSEVDTDGDFLSDLFEITYGLDRYSKDTDGDGYDDGEELAYGYDPSGSGRYNAEIFIEKINVRAPIVFPESRKEADIQKAMAKGVAHYPGTATPGSKGNIYITGHSSDFFWNEGDYKRVFRYIYKLDEGDIIVITLNLKNGKSIKYKYRVYQKFIAQVTSKEVWYADREGSILTLVTSWPLDTTRERMVVRAELIK